MAYGMASCNLVLVASLIQIGTDSTIKIKLGVGHGKMIYIYIRWYIRAPGADHC